MPHLDEIQLLNERRKSCEPEEAVIELEDAIRCALDGDALLFVGAGLSFLSTRKDKKTVSDTATLADLLLEQPVGTGSKHSLDRISGAVVRKKGVDFVYKILRDNFTVESVDSRLNSLYRLPWSRIYTTNYDNAAEVARDGHYPISSITIDETQSSASNGSIIHLNGYIKRVGPANIESKLLLTDASYASSRLVETGWLSFFQHDIAASRAVIFAGYSLYDLDIDKLLLSSDGIHRKGFFFVGPDADEIEVSTLERYGTVVSGGIDALVESIQLVSASYNVPRFAKGLTALREIRPRDDGESKKVPAQKVFDQLVYGVLPEGEVLLGNVAFEQHPYLVVRKQDVEARDAIRQGPWRDIVFVGEIASGKSASTLLLAAYLRNEGYRIFYAQRSSSLIGDLRRLAVIDEKIAVIFDGYSPFRDAITDYAERRKPGHRIIMTENSVVHEFINAFVDKTPHLGPVREIVLNKISDVDASGFEGLINFGGFWGERAGASPVARQKYITNALDSSLYRILVEIIKSEKVKRRIRELLDPIFRDSFASKVFCCALIVNYLKFPFTISEWQYLFDRNRLRTMMVNYADQIKYFVSSDSDHIYIRNGLLSVHILHDINNPELIKYCLQELYKQSETLSGSDGNWVTLRIELTKFSSIERIFHGDNRAEEIFSYYDSIRAYGNTRNNSDYWLQLGIAATVFDELERGKICFENAYARERSRPAPNLTKIDNYSARFDMKRAVAEDDSKVAFRLFLEAYSKLSKQIFLDINRHYPFKTGRYFADMAAKHYDNWDDAKKAKFLDATKDIQKRAIEWKNNSRDFSADVEILIRETKDIIQSIATGH